jgi:DNA-binding PadR family transcriptional regulator
MSTADTMAQRPHPLPGTLDLLILRTLRKDALHGWAISERIREISEDVLQRTSHAIGRIMELA